jgi:hypothetical protein
MTFIITVAHENNRKNTWEEEYTKNCENPEQWAKEIIENFNRTLRPGEKERVLLNVVIKDDIKDYSHCWEKINLITIIKGKQTYDEYKCKNCGITGKRHGIDHDIVRDNKYTGKKYADCKWKTKPTGGWK